MTPKKLLVLLLLLPCPLPAFERFTRSQLLMGDIEVTITVVADSITEKDKVWKAMDNAFTEARAIEKRVSEWQPESDTSLLNKTEGNPPRVVNRDLLLILLLAKDVSMWTGGAFDVTYPSSEKTASYQDMVIDETQQQVGFKRSGIQLGVSGIAKGYILDQMADQLKKVGLQNALINASGDLRAIGQDGDNPWEIQLIDGQQTCSFFITNQAVATTSTAERGRHIIDPRLKQPVETMRSVTVFAPTSSLAGPLAVGTYVLGSVHGFNFLKKAKNTKGMIIDLKGNKVWSKGLSPRCH